MPMVHNYMELLWLSSLATATDAVLQGLLCWSCTNTCIVSWQEHIEPAKPAREHVTSIDSDIQTWLPDTNFNNIQIWKGSNVRMHSCVLRVPWHGLRVNRGFNPIQQQPSHSSRQQRTTHPRVLSFWTEKHLGLTWWKTVGVHKYPLIHNTLTRSNTPLLTPVPLP